MSGIALPTTGAQRPIDGLLVSDERLARRVARGSTQAFAVLYARHHRALSRYSRTIVQHEQDAQDVLQSAMARALAALQAGERELWVRPWLFRIVHNEAISLLRRRRPQDVLVDEQLPATRDVERVVEERERLALLVEDLLTLTERQRSALVMRELSGLSVDELAVALAISAPAAKQALFEARCALHELAEGRAMACLAARELISERDGRVLRARRLRAHLRVCGDCEAFLAASGVRARELRALAPPLPAIAAGALLSRVVGAAAGGSGHGSGAATLASGGALGAGGAGSLASGSLGLKLLAGVALVTAAATGAADVTRYRGPPQPPAPAAAHATLRNAAATPPAVRLRRPPADRSQPAPVSALRGADGGPSVTRRSELAATPPSATAPTAPPAPVPQPSTPAASSGTTTTLPPQAAGAPPATSAPAVQHGQAGDPPGQAKKLSAPASATPQQQASPDDPGHGHGLAKGHDNGHGQATGDDGVPPGQGQTAHGAAAH